MKNKLKSIFIKFRSGEIQTFLCDEVILNPFYHVELKSDMMGKYPSSEEKEEIANNFKNLELRNVTTATDLVIPKALAHGENIPIIGLKNGELLFLTLLNQIEFLCIEDKY